MRGIKYKRGLSYIECIIICSKCTRDHHFGIVFEKVWSLQARISSDKDTV